MLCSCYLSVDFKIERTIKLKLTRYLRSDVVIVAKMVFKANKNVAALQHL